MLRGSGRWFIAVAVTIAAFWIALLVPALLVLPRWHTPDTDRWVIAAGLGVAVAALAALWGSDFARREPAGTGQSGPLAVHMKAEASGSARINQAGRDLTIHGE
jgi:type VI protein secretion system component VasK